MHTPRGDGGFVMRRIPGSVAIIITLCTFHVSGVSAQTAAPTGDEQKPPAAVGEQGVKPTRGFVSALGHNLADDVKHIPRRNSLYWLAGGSALALAIHPEDGSINRRLLGSS